VAGQPWKVVRWPAHVDKAPPLFPKVVVVEVKERVVEEKREKEGGDGRLDTNFGRPAKLWPQFSSTIHHPPHLDPLMLKPLIKASKVRQIPFNFFQNSFYFLLNFLDFITCCGKGVNKNGG
jgi:hypothetical protein